MAAVGRVAEKGGAVLDNCASICHGPSFLAIFDNGYPSCTLGEVKNRADVVVFWGCNPMHAHPRHALGTIGLPARLLHPEGAQEPDRYLHRPPRDRYGKARRHPPDGGAGA